MKSYPPVELGTLGINRYVHRECNDAFLQTVSSIGKVIEPGRSNTWKPHDLIGQFADIVSCDHCGRTFEKSDSEYVSHWVTKQKELDRIARGNRPKPWWRFW